MNRVPKRRLPAFPALPALLAGLLLAVPLVAADEPTRMSGGGGFPVTASVTSMWGAVDELVSPGQKTVTFMIYFRGTDGWHRRKWKFDQEMEANPFVIEFTCDLTTLRATVDRTSRTLSVFGHQFDIAQTNVVLVERVDHPGEEVVTALGRVDLLMPEDVNPATWVLERYDSIRSKVVVQDKSPLGV